MKRKPSTTVHVNIECKNFSSKSIQGKVFASDFEWNFIWAFGQGRLILEPPLGRALIKDSLETFLIRDDYKLETGGNYVYTIKARF